MRAEAGLHAQKARYTGPVRRIVDLCHIGRMRMCREDSVGARPGVLLSRERARS
jgi:hypothetical protein